MASNKTNLFCHGAVVFLIFAFCQLPFFVGCINPIVVTTIIFVPSTGQLGANDQPDSAIRLSSNFEFHKSKMPCTQQKQVPRGYVKCDCFIVTHCIMLMSFKDFLPINNHICRLEITRFPRTYGPTD